MCMFLSFLFTEGFHYYQWYQKYPITVTAFGTGHDSSVAKSKAFEEAKLHCELENHQLAGKVHFACFPLGRLSHEVECHALAGCLKPSTQVSQMMRPR